MTPTSSERSARPAPSQARRRPDDDRKNEDRLNEAFHTLLRDAAEKREERQRAQSLADNAAAKQESHDLLSLARGL
jgi:hypothetical protein